MNAADRAVWAAKITATMERIGDVAPEAFFDMKTLRYHPASAGVFELADAFSWDHAAWKVFWDANPRPRDTWLPLEPEKVRVMPPMEVFFRLRENMVDERFVDGALCDAFESGSLVAALLRIQEGLDGFELQRD
jgi:hypothetical protein